MTAKECIVERRSIRQFKDLPISHDLLAEIIETASFAPSWKNSQITRYVVVEGNLKNQIASACTEGHPRNGEIITQAPALVVITFIKGRSGFERDGSYTTQKGDSWQMFDAGIATQTFCLAAHEQGIGSVIMGIFDDAKVASILDLPDTQEVAALVPIGYPDEIPVSPKRKTVEDLLSIKS